VRGDLRVLEEVSLEHGQVQYEGIRKWKKDSESVCLIEGNGRCRGFLEQRGLSQGRGLED